MLQKEMLTDATIALAELEAVAAAAKGPDAQGAVMDVITGQQLYRAMQALDAEGDPCEEGLAVIGWALKLLAQGRLGDLLSQTV